MASEWFYSIPPRSLHNFSEITKIFLTQYATHQEAKRSRYHLLYVKMRPGDSLKSYINFFQSQLTKVSNCGEKVYALTFISGLQVTHSLYKHLLKHNITKMSKALSRAQSLIQWEEAMKASSNHSTKPSEDRTKSKSTREAPDYVPNRHRGTLSTRSNRFSIIPSSPILGYRSAGRFTPLKLSIDEVFNTFKDQP